MVKGLELFRECFEEYADRYVVIGGTACDLAMDAVGESFRPTKDLDIVLCLESLDADFVNTFWSFITSGGYEKRQKSTGKNLFYRFHSPRKEAYPVMLELFSRIPDALHFEGDGHLTPIPVREEASSLSAILLDDDYYAFLHTGKIEMDGVPIVRPEYLLPLKAKAWLDLTAIRQKGGRVDSKDIRKHRGDIFRLYRILEPAEIPLLAGQMAEDFRLFISGVDADSIQLKSFGYSRRVKAKDVLEDIKNAYLKRI